MSAEKKLLVIIPALNEEARIRAVIEGVRRYLAEADILVIDDGSSDRTAAVSREAGASAVRHPFNMGVGTALQTGYKYASVHGYEHLIQLDADGQHDPAYLPQFRDQLAKSDSELVIGSRFLDSAGYRGSTIRKIGIVFFGKLVSFLIGEKLTDVTSGYRGMKRHVLQFCTQDMYSFDYPDADFLLAIHRAGFRIQEIPITIHPRLGGESQHRGLRPIYYLLKMFLSIFVILLRKKNIQSAH